MKAEITFKICGEQAQCGRHLRERKSLMPRKAEKGQTTMYVLNNGQLQCMRAQKAFRDDAWGQSEAGLIFPLPKEPV